MGQAQYQLPPLPVELFLSTAKCALYVQLNVTDDYGKERVKERNQLQIQAGYEEWFCATSVSSWQLLKQTPHYSLMYI